MEGLEHFVLFCDNLSIQTHEDFKAKISSMGDVVWFGVPNGTDLWQPVDAGFGQLLKTLINHKFTEWLEGDQNADRWYGHTSFTARERRILISNWAGNAYNDLIGEKYEGFRWLQFEKTGCLITADGSEDHKISPEGLDGYKVPPPLLLDPALEPSQGNTTSASDPILEELDRIEPSAEEFEDCVLKEVDCLEDKVEDRIQDHDLKGKKMQVLYDSGWFLGRCATTIPI